MMNRSRRRDTRGTTFLWCDKRIIRFFRHNFNKKHYKNLRSVYMALCEIDSDFHDTQHIKGFKKTLSTYAGRSAEIITRYFLFLQELEIVDALPMRDNQGRYQWTRIWMFVWTDQAELFMDNKEHLMGILDGTITETTLYGNRGRRITGHENPCSRESMQPENCFDKEYSINKEYNTNKKTLFDISTTQNNTVDSEVSKPTVDSEVSKPTVDSEVSKPTVTSTSRLKTKSHYVHKAKKLAEIVSNKMHVNKNSSVYSWAKSFELLHKKDKVKIKRINEVLNWYADAIGEKYVPQAFSGDTFRRKFINLEQAMQRSLSNQNDVPVNRGMLTDEKGQITETQKENLESYVRIREFDLIICRDDEDVEYEYTLQDCIDMIKSNNIPKHMNMEYLERVRAQENL